MSNYSFQNKIKKIVIVYFVFFSFLSVSAVFTNAYGAELSALQKQARIYRAQGLEQQNVGNLDAAMSLYQKAIELDPAYAVAYNDLGIIFEARGMTDRAEDSYQAAITVDPSYLSSYSNLALLYETKNDFDKAISYWKKRAQLGEPKDPWTKKARERFDALIRMSPSYKKSLMESEVLELDKRVAELKKIKKQEDLKKAKEYLATAKKLYNDTEYTKAINQLKSALSLDPQEKDALKLMEMAKAKIIEQEKKAKEEKKKRDIQNMQSHFETGVKYYQQDNLQAAKEEFGKIKELAASPLKK